MTLMGLYLTVRETLRADLLCHLGSRREPCEGSCCLGRGWVVSLLTPACFISCWKGEKGEPGAIISPDGTGISAGTKGDKVTNGLGLSPGLLWVLTQRWAPQGRVERHALGSQEWPAPGQGLVLHEGFSASGGQWLH